MKLVVLGRTGQLGAELLTQASQNGFEAVGLGSDVDVTDRTGLESALDAAKPQIVVNATAYHVVPECEQHPDRAFAVNAVAVKSMAEACAARGIRFATYSTDYVFDGRKGETYLEDGLHRALRAALQNRTAIHVRVLDLDALRPANADKAEQSEQSVKPEATT